jgi:hypothetical protein
MLYGCKNNKGKSKVNFKYIYAIYIIVKYEWKFIQFA